MKVGMLESVGLVLIESLIIYGIFKKFITVISGNKRNFKQAALIGIVSILLLSAHLYIFQVILKQDNYYELMQIQRAYSTDKLSKKARQIMSAHHPDKTKSGDSTYFNKLSLIRDTLSDPIYQSLYDVFGEFTIPENHTQAEFKRQALQMEACINIFGFFSVYFIVSTVTSYGKRFKSYRILSNIILLALFAQEIYLCSMAGEGAELLTKSNPQKRVTKNNRFEIPKDEFLDKIFPNMATFERLILLRLIALAVITGMRLYFDLQFKEEVNSHEDELEIQINKLKDVLEAQQNENQNQIRVTRQSDLSEKPLDQQMPDENQLKTRQEIIEQIYNLAKKHRDSKPKDGKIYALVKKAVKITILLMFGYSILNSFLGINV